MKYLINGVHELDSPFNLEEIAAFIRDKIVVVTSKVINYGNIVTVEVIK